MDPVLVERQGQVQVVTINRPAARNAVDLAVARGIAAALDELDASPELRAAVLTGAGGTFSAGMDLKAFLRGELPVAGDRGFAGITRRAARKPLLAAVEGAALGGGLEIVLSCDLVVASRSGSFGLPEVRRSLVAGAGALIRLPRRIPYHLAMELALTGEPVAAERAAALGLVNRVVEPGRALAAALELAALVVRGGPLVGGRRALLERGRRLAPPGRAGRRAGRLGGRPGGRPGLRREAGARLAGPLTGREHAKSGRSAGRGPAAGRRGRTGDRGRLRPRRGNSQGPGRPRGPSRAARP
jgi:enoyl-CoA hydratase